MDLFIGVGEASGDLLASKVVGELLTMKPDLKVGAVAGPHLRSLDIEELFQMERLKVMGFIDVIMALPKIAKQFFAIRNKLLDLKPKVVVFVDYPGFHLRLAKSLRKKGYRGKIIHFVCPTVWAWGKKRIPLMANNLDLLLTLFPFEKECFKGTSLDVRYVGHPLAKPIAEFVGSGKFGGMKILGLFPGSRKEEIEKNLPIQLKVAKRLKESDKELVIVISAVHPIEAEGAIVVGIEDTYDLMKASHLAIATSGTATLELALHGTPTVVNFAIRWLDCLIAQKIFKIDLPFYCIANIVAGKEVFPEFFGPNLTEEKLLKGAQKLWFEKQTRQRCLEGCDEVRKSLGVNNAAKKAAEAIESYF